MKIKLPGLVNNAGFSLVEVMVAAGVMGVVALGSMQLMNNVNDGQKRMWQLLNLSDIVAQVQNSLRNQDTCRRTLTQGAPMTIPTDGSVRNFNDLLNADGTISFDGPAEFGTGTGKLWITGFQLISTGNNLAGQAKDATVRVRYQKRNNANTGWLAITTRDLPLKVVPSTSTAAATVTRCYLSDMSGPACSALGGSFDDTTGRCSTVDLSGQPGADLRLPSDGDICRGTVCQTVFNSNQTCPWGSMDARCINVVGISGGGTLMCGAAPAGTPCTP